MLSDTYDWAVRTPIDNISEFVRRSAGLPLYVVGSGGSLSAATFASILHQQTGTMSRYLTPLEFLELDSIDDHCAVLILTAGGNNGDILSTFDRAADLEPELLGALCASTDNRLTRRASTHPEVFIHAVRPPTGKDGFLATNSLLATEVWLARAYAVSSSLVDRLPGTSRSLLYDGIPEKEFAEKMLDRLHTVGGRDTIIILHDSWGKAAAVDAESKLAEAGLISVQLADYRNFAHGRHNWLDKNRERTGIIALVTPKCAKLVARTLRLIPEYVPTVEMLSSFDGPAASLNLLVKVMYMVKFFGNLRGIDPGRPQVVPFGRKIYHLTMPKNNSEPSDRERKVLLRKFPNLAAEKGRVVQKVTHLRRFIRNLENARFDGIIFDYDGTLCDPDNRLIGPSSEIGMYLTKLLQGGILVGIATGRGKSVRNDLQKMIPKIHWQKILVGYYNGADLGYLDDDSKPDVASPADSDLEEFFDTVQENNLLPQNCMVEKRPLQISIQGHGITADELISKIDTLKLRYNSIKIVESSHSVDMVAGSISKLNLFDKMRETMGSDDLKILCIGDKGRWPGNDAELLKTKYSLSVNETSDDVDSCWNMLSPGVSGEAGVLEYLKSAKIYDHHFMLSLGMKK